jgi:hypothetical protein
MLPFAFAAEGSSVFENASSGGISQLYPLVASLRVHTSLPSHAPHTSSVQGTSKFGLRHSVTAPMLIFGGTVSTVVDVIVVVFLGIAAVHMSLGHSVSLLQTFEITTSCDALFKLLETQLHD